ncbi:hypothetical protein B0H10DRAFT_2327199 [Mycena sp. CBHHK59/15]|nr:hypothetical protein B0H10DRAFT_2327199 [Mycena sp. CBHHK59/15]
MFLKSLMFLGLLAIANAADILTFKITDFQGSALDLTSGSPSSLTPVQSVKNTRKKSQNASRRIFSRYFMLISDRQWMFIYAAHGDENEYRIINVAGSSILSYTTANDNVKGPAPGIHTQIVGNQNVSTNWDVLSVPKGYVKWVLSRNVNSS